MNTNNIFEENDCCACAGTDLVLLAAMVSIILAQDLDSLQQNILGNFIQTVGQNLTVMAAARIHCNTIVKHNN